MAKSKTTYYIDIPTVDCIDNPDGAWRNVAIKKSKRAAVAFIRKHFGPCDKDGRISLISPLQTE